VKKGRNLGGAKLKSASKEVSIQEAANRYQRCFNICFLLE
jgi:hypothetical protein